MSDKKKKTLDLKWTLVIQLCIAFISMMLMVKVSNINETEKILINSKHQVEVARLNGEINKLQSELDDLHDLSWENIDYWIDTLHIEHPDIVKQQIALETGMLTSDICLDNSNLFGMKEPRVRETTALGTRRGHAYYHSYIESIKDYKLWQDNMYDGHDDYYAFLSEAGYAEAQHYIAALKGI